MRSLLTLLAAGLLSVVLTRAFLAYMQGRQIVAEENHRSMHKGRIPVGAGWPLLVSALIAALALWPFAGVHSVLLPAIAALAIVSWADDVNALAPSVRFLVHIAAAVAAVYALPSDALIFSGLLPFALDRLVAGVALVWFVNLTNFMDGIDGITGIEAITVAGGYGLVRLALGPAGDDALIGLAIAITGAALGFLVWNWHPARIFMGDVGAVPLGFIMGWLMLDLAVRGHLAAALILPSTISPTPPSPLSGVCSTAKNRGRPTAATSTSARAGCSAPILRSYRGLPPATSCWCWRRCSRCATRCKASRSPLPRSASCLDISNSSPAAARRPRPSRRRFAAYCFIGGIKYSTSVRGLPVSPHKLGVCVISRT